MSDQKKKRATKKPGKRAADLTDEQVLRRLFPKRVREIVKREAEDDPKRRKG